MIRIVEEKENAQKTYTSLIAGLTRVLNQSEATNNGYSITSQDMKKILSFCKQLSNIMTDQ